MKNEMGVTDLSTFNNTNLLFVVVLLGAMCYCRVIGEFLLNNCVAWEEFLTHRCLQACCGCDKIGALHVVRGALILYTFSLPVLFCAAHVYRSMNNLNVLSVFLMPRTPYINACVITEAQNSTNATSIWTLYYAPEGDLANMLVHCYMSFSHTILDAAVSIDAIYIVLPLAFASSVNCLIWVNLTKSNTLTETTVWDTSLEDDVVSYEVSFLVECFFSNLALIFIAASGSAAIDLLIFVCLVGAIETFFVQIAKISDHSVFDTFIAFGVLLQLCFVIFLYVPFLDLSSPHNPVATALLVVFVLRLSLNVMLHYAAHGQMNAGYIILFRLTNVLFVSSSLLVFYFVVE